MVRTWLNQDSIALVVANAIKYRDEKLYELIAYCIMPNHVHLVFNVDEDTMENKSELNENYRVTKILQRLKQFTAHESNGILKRKGQFWHRESYDHIIRNSKEMTNIISYVLMNPV